MRGCPFVLILISGFFVAAPVTADDARAQIEKSVQAHGGAAALAKMQRMTRYSSGSMFLFGQETIFRDELIMSLPSKWRLNLVSGSGDHQKQMVIIVNENDSWQWNALGVSLMSKERNAELQDESHVMWYATLVPLLQDKSLQLAQIPGVNVEGRPTRGISVNLPGKTEVRLYFDAQSNLLVKIARKSLEAGIQVDKEYFYAHHKPVDGVLLPSKYSEFTSGRKLVEVNTIKYKFLETVDDKLFTKP
jgi:hypothetical protein